MMLRKVLKAQIRYERSQQLANVLNKTLIELKTALFKYCTFGMANKSVQLPLQCHCYILLHGSDILTYINTKSTSVNAAAVNE